MDEPIPAIAEERDNLTRLLNLGRRKRPRINRRYSSFVRGMRLVLPLTALAIVAVVLAWPRMDDAIAPIPKESIIPQGGGRNELISPHFESTTNSQLPYVVTAARAVQSQKDEALVLLEGPVADVTLAGGATVNAKSDNGVYRQDTEMLVLDGHAVLLHSSGHSLKSSRMNISMKDQLAWSDTPVDGDGPSGTIAAQTMNANNATGVLIFTGPAKLVLTQSGKGLKP
jgi:lipopolysaccharide export system protein LptC